MTHRKHTKRPKGELVATTANPKEKPQKCKIAYQNRQIKEYVNIPIAITIGSTVTAEALKELKKMKGVRYYVTLFSIKKEVSSFEAAEYLKGGFKIEIVEE